MNSAATALVHSGKVGVAIPHFNTQTVAAFPVPLPPTAEQDRLVAEIAMKLSVTEQVEMEVMRQLQHSDRLRQSILKRAFEGKLVPQDPNDEPASALLERIRAESTVCTNLNSKKHPNRME
jgi:type I restriction enzyme S subunit